MEQARKLQPLDLLKIYGEIAFEWHLQSDRISWSEHLSRLISPEASLVTGGAYLNLLSPHALDTRMKALAEARTSKDHAYVCQYALSLPSFQKTLVREEGQISFEGGEPKTLQGNVRFMDEDVDTHAQHQQPLGGYDALTGFPSKEVLFENLASVLEQASYSGLPGAYAVISLDRLTYLAAKYGYETLFEIFKGVGERLRHEIRFNDMIGRTSGSCLGMVLQDCDRWGVVRTADRLLKSVKNLPLATQAGPVEVTLSAAGLVFPERALSAEDVMRQTEQYLFDHQNQKGIGIAITPYGESLQSVPEPKDEAQRRRFR